MSNSVSYVRVYNNMSNSVPYVRVYNNMSNSVPYVRVYNNMYNSVHYVRVNNSMSNSVPYFWALIHRRSGHLQMFSKLHSYTGSVLFIYDRKLKKYSIYISL